MRKAALQNNLNNERDFNMLQRDDFITRLAKKGYTKHDAEIIMDDFLRTLEEALVDGESVRFRGFGMFDVRERSERESVDPQTKDRIVIPSYRAVKFTAGKLLKREVKEGLIRD